MVVPRLHRDEIYQCRLVCKHWLSAIDTLLENPPYHHQHDDNVPELILKRKYSSSSYMHYAVRLMTEKTLRRLENLTETATNNPFIGRSIIINPEVTNFGWENHLAQHSSPKLETLFKILERFGQYVYHLKWVVPGSSINVYKFYIILCRLLSYLPNLKTLCVRFWIKPQCNRGSLALQIFDNFSLPQIDSLYSVKLNVLQLPQYIENKIVSSLGTCVKKLSLPISFNLVNTFHCRLINLNELSLRSIFDFSLLKELLGKIKLLQIPVKKLKLRFGKPFDIIEILNNVSYLNIGFLNTGKSDLKDDLFHKGSKDNLMNYSMHTLKIKDSFELEYKFLCYLPNLKYLIVKTNYVVGKWYAKSFREGKFVPGNNEVSYHIRLCLYGCIPPAQAFWKNLPKLEYLIVDPVDDKNVEYLDHPFVRYPRSN